MENAVVFEKKSFIKRTKSMLKVDFKRLFLSRTFYIIVAACLVAPILIFVMTSMMDGSVSVNPQTGEETVIEGFDNVWQIIGSVNDPDANAENTSGDMAAMDMGITSMCNINMLYFGIAALVCIFVAEDFRSGYSKSLFTVRSKKTDYVMSKTIVMIFGAAMMVLAFFAGSLVGGAVSGVSFEMIGFNITNLVMCVLSKMVLVSVFVPIYLIMSVVAKQKLWMSILLSMMVGMFLFMMIPMLTPLNARLGHVLIGAVGGVGFGIGLGAISNLVLKKTSLV
ncbi:MAG: hypothetical protein E7667_07705 [Ruminococcaceae bacterium]|nr:hypothetical protein [Oscillospiraceae bacterium]